MSRLHHRSDRRAAKIAGTQDRALSQMEAWPTDLQASARRLGAGLWAGIISGFVIGGIGGRLAMFLLRVTSDPSLHGVETDDGFRIGEFTGDTMFLLFVATALGALGGIFYLIVRKWLPERPRPFLIAGLAALVGGSIVIRPEGIDFKVLDPLALAIALFILLPGLYGFALSILAERFLSLASRSRLTGWLPAVIPLIGLVALGPVGLIVVIVGGLGWVFNRVSDFTRLWSSRGVAQIGRVALSAGGLFALYALGKDIAEIM